MRLNQLFQAHETCRPRTTPANFTGPDLRQLFFRAALNALQPMLFGEACPFCGPPNFGQQATSPNSFPTWHCDLTGQQRSSWSQPQPSTPVALPHPQPTLAQKPKAKPPAAKGATSRVRLLTQSNEVSCGQTSVAMAVNSLTGKKLNDRQIDSRYGFGLLNALRTESKGSGYTWNDHGDFSKSKWPLLEKKLNTERTPVLLGLNGPQFSPSGRGHIVTLLSIDGNKVRYADPADGKVKTTTRQAIEKAGRHPDGNFIFCASKAK